MSLPAPPQRDFLRWVTERPHEVAQYLQTIASLSRLELVLIVDGRTTRVPLRLSGNNAQLVVEITTQA